MFEKEILNKNIVELYDNQLHFIMSGVITGFKAKAGYIIINSSVFFPIRHVAKIAVHTNDKIQSDQTGTNVAR